MQAWVANFESVLMMERSVEAGNVPMDNRTGAVLDLSVDGRICKSKQLTPLIQSVPLRPTIKNRCYIRTPSTV